MTEKFRIKIIAYSPINVNSNNLVLLTILKIRFGWVVASTVKTSTLKNLFLYNLAMI